MSRTPVINQAISIPWLTEHGWLSAKDLWCKAQGNTGKKRKTSSNVRRLVRHATTLNDLQGKAKEKTDLQAAQEMQKAKADLFAMFNKPGRKNSA